MDHRDGSFYAGESIGFRLIIASLSLHKRRNTGLQPPDAVDYGIRITVADRIIVLADLFNQGNGGNREVHSTSSPGKRYTGGRIEISVCSTHGYSTFNTYMYY